MRRVLLLITILAPLVLFISGCGEEVPESPPVSSAPKKIIPAPSKGEGSSSAENVPISEPPKYRYDPTGRDPFESLLEIKKPVTSEEALTPLQKFDLAQLRLIAVIIGKGEPKAMVIAPDGKSYILKKGIKVGKNDGTVIEVNQDAIVVQERYIDFSGEVRTVVQEIRLPKKEGVE